MLQEGTLCGAIDDVEDFRHRFHAAGVFELLAHHARHPAFQPFFHFVDDFRIGLPHRGDAAHHGQLPLAGQTGDDARGLRRRQIGDDERDGLRMFVDDERQQILAIDFLQKSERQGFNLLANIIERVGGVFAEGLFDQRFRDFQSAGAAPHAAWRGVGEFVDNNFLLVASGVAHLGNFDRHRLDLFRLELGDNFRRLVLRQAGQQHGGFANCGGGHVVSCFPCTRRRARRRRCLARGGRRCAVGGGGRFVCEVAAVVAGSRRWHRRLYTGSGRLICGC